MPAAEQDMLKRSLKPRHIQMIALGGVIGTGLFYGSAEVIQLAGPAAILAYLLGGIIIYFIMRMLGEMAVETPVSGAFSFYAYEYWGPLPGFIAGWNYWFLYILVSMAELTVIGLYLDYWIEIAHWKTSLIVLLVVTGINLIHVRFFGECEFWISFLKILAVIGMIVFGLVIVLAGLGDGQAGISNLWQHGGFFPHGLTGILLATTVVMFAFGGTELIGVTAGEASDPQKSIPKAISKVIWRILVFYIGSIAIIMMLGPWQKVASNASPFVTIFETIGLPAAGHILNFVVIIAAISVYNSGIYANGRMLYSLACQNNAPHFFAKLNHRQVPARAVIFSSLCTAIIVAINYLIPDNAFMRILALATAAAAITWIMIIIGHLKFRAHQRQTKKASHYPFGLAPFANYLCLVFFASLFIIMLISGLRENGLMTRMMQIIAYEPPTLIGLIPEQMPDMSLAVIIMPLWCLLLFIFYKIKKLKPNRPV
ncbi:amino acid permease [Bartonella sp. DGB2]|uniref:amino acid permease n=1 Tax=Bartonella sp. DGB2 TaxID=3388426 RepID=UPI00398FEC25